MASSQHRCVFVGNIPYDATEEQLIEICQEVGPVVSFRLVIDRETGRPKGYGFCEYKDEETALSARRNLQGYEINGRQLRVDFAENDKGSDRNREQGRGGPGLASDIQKQGAPTAIQGESVQHQPIGLHIAITAATVMAGALGGAQMLPSQNGLQSQSALANDPLTLHLAKMSRSQLNDLLSELKAMATQNKELARQLLRTRPQLSKALFQAEIMLGLVTPQVLQMSNIRQAPSQPSKPAFGDVQLSQQAAVPSLSGLPPLAQRVPTGSITNVQPGTAVPQSSFIQNQISGPTQATIQPQMPLPPQANFQQGTLPGPSGALTSLQGRSQSSIASSSAKNQQILSSSLQHQVGAADLGNNVQIGLPNAVLPPTLVGIPSSDAIFQNQPSIASGSLPRTTSDAGRSAQVAQDVSSISLSDQYRGRPLASAERTKISGDLSDQSNRPTKLMKLEDGAKALPVGPSSSQPVPKAGQYFEKQISQSQLPPDVESVLLQQVMNLTPEQLSSLPPEQQQQVIQLQQMLRRDQHQAS